MIVASMIETVIRPRLGTGVVVGMAPLRRSKR
jgi:hypothetical protein